MKSFVTARSPGRCFCLVAALALIGLLHPAVSAAGRGRPVQIGVLTPVWGATPQVKGLRDGLRELGYRENEDFVIGIRFTRGDLSALPRGARDLVNSGADLIVAHDAAAVPAHGVTAETPIVFVGVNDPVGTGLVESYSRPGGNVTGVADRELELAPKRLELFREVVPDLERVLFIYDSEHAYSSAGAAVYRKAASALGVDLVERAVRSEREARQALTRVRKDGVDGILRPPSESLNIPGYILEAARREAIPTMFNGSFWVEQGALASYGEHEYASGRQAARLVDRILKGKNPADVPVEANMSIEFAINLKVAKALGLKVKPEVLYRADRLVR